jgi:hypothetical protein
MCDLCGQKKDKEKECEICGCDFCGDCGDLKEGLCEDCLEE